MARLYGKKTSDGLPKALECTDEGLLKVDTELTATIDPTGLATEATAADVKTAVEALAVATPDTAAGDLADINTATASIDGKLPALVGGKIPVDASVSIDSIDIGDVDIKEFPAGNLGQQLKAASLSVAPATDIIDATYIGDVKFGEELPAGTQLVGKVGIDQSTANANEVVVKSQTTGPADIVKAEDAAHSSGDKGIMALAVRSDTVAAKAGTDGDYAPLIVDANGCLWVQFAGVLSSDLDSISQYSLSPYPKGATKWTSRGTSDANTAQAVTQAAQAGKQHYVIGYRVTIRGAEAGAAGVTIVLRDGATGTGTDKGYDSIPAGAAIGSRVESVSPNSPLLQGTVNTAATLDVSAAGADCITEVTIWGYYL